MILSDYLWKILTVDWFILNYCCPRTFYNSSLQKNIRLHQTCKLVISAIYRKLSWKQNSIKPVLHILCTGVLPKSVNPKHIEENAHIFDFQLSAEHMSHLSGINHNVHYCWDPSSVLWHVFVLCRLRKTCSEELRMCHASQQYFSKHSRWIFQNLLNSLLQVIGAGPQ